MLSEAHVFRISILTGRLNVCVYGTESTLALRNWCTGYTIPLISNPTITLHTPSHCADMTSICVLVKSIVIPDVPVQSILSMFQEDCGIAVSTALPEVEVLLTMFAVDPEPLAKIQVMSTKCDFPGI